MNATSDPKPFHAGARVFVAGHRGLVGGAIVRALEASGFARIITRTRAELDLRSQDAVRAFYAAEKPEFVFVAAAKVGGILANDTYPADFLYENLVIETNLIHGAHEAGVEKLLFLGSTCIYPKLAPQPLKESYLLTGPLEPTNEWYAVAKIAGIKMCEAYHRQYGRRFVAAMPTNLYGPGDNFDLKASHVMPALIRKFHEAKLQKAPTVPVWGSGTPLREFMHVDDCARACILLMERYEGPGFVNVGVGSDISIRDLAALVSRVVGFEGDIVFDPTKPDGTPRKLVDVTELGKMGFSPRLSLEEGVRDAYAWFLANETSFRR